LSKAHAASGQNLSDAEEGGVSRVEKHRGFLVKLPWLKQGLFTGVAARTAFASIRESFEQTGYKFGALDERTMRFSAYRERHTGDCTCIHVIWVRIYQGSTYISYGIEPRFLFFWLCRRGDHLTKLSRCGWAVRRALEGSAVQ
jgi:hypothetical protein